MKILNSKYSSFFIFGSICIVLFIFSFALPLSAEEDMPDEYKNFTDSVPPEITDKLPDGFFSDSINDVSDSAGQMSKIEFLLSELLSAAGTGIQKCIPTLALICGIIIIGALCRTVGNSLTGAPNRIVGMCTEICVFSSVCAVSIRSLETVSTYFENLRSVMLSFLSLSGVLYAIGGNFSAAASSTAGLTVTLSICEFICTYTVIPIFCICLCMALITSLEPNAGVLGLCSSIKKWYNTLLSFLMMIITTALSAGTFVSARADNAAMRGAKFVAGNFIPVSGGAVSSSLGTLASSVELIRTSVGTIGVIVIILLILPVILELIFMRMVFGFCSFIAGLSGCSGEKKLLDELSSLYGYLEGVCILCTVVFVVFLAIMAFCASAVGR